MPIMNGKIFGQYPYSPFLKKKKRRRNCWWFFQWQSVICPDHLSDWSRAKDIAALGGRLGPGEKVGLLSGEPVAVIPSSPFIPWSWNGNDPLLCSNAENIADPKNQLPWFCLAQYMFIYSLVCNDLAMTFLAPDQPLASWLSSEQLV